jgi:hypothetical protein
VTLGHAAPWYRIPGCAGMTVPGKRGRI